MINEEQNSAGNLQYDEYKNMCKSLGVYPMSFKDWWNGWTQPTIDELQAKIDKLIVECETLKGQRDKAQTAIKPMTPPSNQPLFPHYFREVPSNTTHVDVYWVLKAWDVTDPCVQHAIKKLMAAGMRGAKDVEKDLKEARDSITRALELRKP